MLLNNDFRLVLIIILFTRGLFSTCNNSLKEYKIIIPKCLKLLLHFRNDNKKRSEEDASSDQTMNSFCMTSPITPLVLQRIFTSSLVNVLMFRLIDLQSNSLSSDMADLVRFCVCISSFSHFFFFFCDRTPDRITFKDEGLILS